jgi:WD40 repeat protein
MAEFRRRQSRQIAAALSFLCWSLATSPLGSVEAAAQTLYEQPTLVVDPDQHTAEAKTVAGDAAGRFFVTGSYDKTIRIWSAPDGKLLRTIRVPEGPGGIGKIYAVAMSPDGAMVAAGGWTESDNATVIYIFDRDSGKMTARIANLRSVTNALAFSKDGRHLAAGLHGRPGHGDGLLVFDRDKNWSEVARDPGYGDQSNGVAFAADGRLAVASRDGKVRLYDKNFKLIATQDRLSARQPFGLAFSPDGTELAVGFGEKPTVSVLDAHDLAPRPAPDVRGLEGGWLLQVAWSADGQRLYAGGVGMAKALDRDRHAFVFAWDQAGSGKRRAIPARCAADENTTTGLLPTSKGELLVLKFNPCLTLLKPDGTIRYTVPPAGGDFRDQESTFSVSGDGTIVDFGFAQWGREPLRFDLRALQLSASPPKDGATKPPKQQGVRIENWRHSFAPTLDGKPILLETQELSHSYALHPDGRRFVLGTEWSLRAFDADGKQLWNRPTSIVYDVNVTGDGRLAVAAYGDGTIRWHRMDDGRELLALQVLANKQDWVAWTPEGFYGATPGAYGVLRWHVNRGPSAAADAIPVSQIPRLKRPDALRLVLQELETARALGIADLAAARFDVQQATGAAKPPGARLHVLAIGVNDYGDKAAALKLKFAAQDARDVANALLLTQGGDFNKKGGLYADVKPQYLHDRDADRAGILGALETIKTSMANGGSDQDLAVVLFSGHGVTVDDQFYLLPYGADTGTPGRIKASAISANELQGEIAQLAKHGRVLLLLDACHSGAAAGDGSKLSANIDAVRMMLASPNVTVLTSSTGDEASFEDEKLGHGAFTTALLEALGKEADEDHDGLVSLSELTHYLFKRVPSLAEQAKRSQHPNVEQRFEAELFVAGQ